ncbi:MAG: hypothetical protein ACPLRW_12115 [Moorellales bacterium]
MIVVAKAEEGKTEQEFARRAAARSALLYEGVAEGAGVAPPL